jgi:hypothetical protein
MPHVECLACKTRLHNTESQSRSDRGSCPVCGSLLASVGNLSEIVRVPRTRVMRRHVAPRRIRGGAADRRRGRRDHRLTRAQTRTSPGRNRKLRRSASRPTSPSLGSRAPGSGEEAVRHRHRAPTPSRAAATAARPRSFRCGASSARTRRQTQVRTSRSAQPWQRRGPVRATRAERETRPDVSSGSSGA